MDKSKLIFNNKIEDSVYRKAVKNKKKYIKKYGDDSNKKYSLSFEDIDALKNYIPTKNIVIDYNKENLNFKDEKPIIIGNIRMGFGHYRISMAIASAAIAKGYTPYWFDLHSFKETTGGKVIANLNDLYSLGSRLSQRYSLFNKLYWEPLNSEGFKKLSYNAKDQKVAELMTPIFTELPKDTPFIATHVWPSQAAIHAGMKNVINVIPDNWPMALHLSEGAIHTVQTPSSFLGYKTLKNMDGDKILNPIPDEEIVNVGHYIDHELVANLEEDTKKRLYRIENNKTKRFLLTVGGAGAQKDIYISIIKKLMPDIKEKKVALYINVGDHKSFFEDLVKEIPELGEEKTGLVYHYFNNYKESTVFAERALDNEVNGIHIFYNEDIFAAVYITNLLMRACDLCITKPSELAFYPVPKLLIKRVGGHEAYGAIRSSEVGDGTIECESTNKALQMIDLILSGNEILKMFNENILKAKTIGIYDGAYKVIDLAVKNI
ncbi:MAG: hypothetical protein E7212_15455 [Clostridium sartagoforme]|nr:hypothetical protein [Clostridium sartagoforme]